MAEYSSLPFNTTAAVVLILCDVGLVRWKLSAQLITEHCIPLPWWYIISHGYAFIDSTLSFISEWQSHLSSESVDKILLYMATEMKLFDIGLDFKFSSYQQLHYWKWSMLLDFNRKDILQESSI